MAGPRIVQAVRNRVEADARVRRAGRALRDAGYEVIYAGEARQPSRDGGVAFVEAEPLDDLQRYLLIDPFSHPYDWVVERLDRANPLRRGKAERRISETLREALASSALPANERAAALSLALPYGAAFAAQRLGAFEAAAKPRRWTMSARFAYEVLALGPDAVHAHDLETFRLLAHACAARRIPIVYDAHELERGRNAPLWSPLQKRLHAESERLTIHLARGVITVSPAIAEILEAAYGIERPTVVANAPPKVNIRPNAPLRERLGLPAGARVVLYLGAIQSGRGIPALLRAIAQLPLQVHAVLLGPVAPDFARKLEGLLESVGPHRARIHLRPPVPYADLIHEAWGADLGFNALEICCESYANALPNKFFEYVFANVPSISTPQRDVVRLSREYELGEVVAEGDFGALLEVMRRRLSPDSEKPIPRGKRQSFIDTHAWESQERRLVDLYGAVLATRKPT